MDFSLIKRFFTALPRPKMVHVEVAAVLLLAVFCFWAGGASKPTKVVEKQVEVTKTVTVTHEDATRVNELTAQLRELQTKLSVTEQNRRWHRVTVKRPDGTSETSETLESSLNNRTESAASSDSTSHGLTTEKQTVDHKTSVDQSIVKEKTILNQQPQWLLTPMAGWSFNDHSVIYGAMLSRRFIGPVWVGAWAHNRGPEVGLAVSLEF